MERHTPAYATEEHDIAQPCIDGLTQVSVRSTTSPTGW